MTTGTEADSGELDEANLAGDAAEADEHGALTASTSLVDLGQEGIGRVGDNGGGHTSDHAGGDGDAHLGALAESGAVGEGSVDGLRSGTLHGELGHGVGDLLEENGHEPE